MAAAWRPRGRAKQRKGNVGSEEDGRRDLGFTGGKKASQPRTLAIWRFSRLVPHFGVGIGRRDGDGGCGDGGGGCGCGET